MVTPSVTTGQQAFESRTRLTSETKTPSQLIYSAMYWNFPKSSHLPLVSIAKSPCTSFRKFTVL